MKFPPVTELELSLQLLPDSIWYCEYNLRIYRTAISPSARTIALLGGIQWLGVCQKQLATAERAARQLGLIKGKKGGAS